MKDIVRKDFDGNIAIWGKVERVAGFETDVYDLWLYVVDVSTDPPMELYHRNARTESVSGIPHVYVKEAIDRLWGETPAPPRPPDPAIEEQNLKGRPGRWNVHTEDFTPKHTQYTPCWGRIMLYAYWPAGTVEWDDIVLKQVASQPADTKSKELRPSLETKVRTKDIPKK